MGAKVPKYQLGPARRVRPGDKLAVNSFVQVVAKRSERVDEECTSVEWLSAGVEWSGQVQPSEVDLTCTPEPAPVQTPSGPILATRYSLLAEQPTNEVRL